ncbi:MAG: HAMP domain-containing histidine kinase [Oxalobacteraceae bacterium]|nr:MAG: HAMP domain-containing histidine kinase [Oxalobacteraceae bacterium]
MLELRDQVFDTWLQRVKERVVEARNVEPPILIDTMPVFYDNIAESLSPDYPRTSAVDGTTVAAEHGGERARITAYNQAALIEEYQIFRATIFDVLHRENVRLDFNETHAINSSIDSGIQEAVEAFSLVHSGFRERFAAALTHDLRGPLAATMTALDLILLLDDPARIRAVAAKALSSTRRMADMVDELLHTMKFHSGERIELALSHFDICEILAEVQAEAPAAWGPRFDLDARPVNGYWDRAALKRTLENLVSNAVKYGSPGTPVTIKVDDVYGRLLLSVHNEGAPIPPDEQECIFQMYRRAESAISGDKQGWGIGLPYVRAVAESHGGSIGLDTSQERGTTFVVDIPVDGSLYANAPTLSQPA